MDELLAEMKLLIRNKDHVKKDTLLDKLEEIKNEYFKLDEKRLLLEDILDDKHDIEIIELERKRLLQEMFEVCINRCK